MAIVIAQDTPKARAVANERKIYFAERFNIELPIVIYDPEKENVYSCSDSSSYSFSV